MKSIRVVIHDLRRALLSWKFLYSVLGVFFILLATAASLKREEAFTSVWYVLTMTVQGSGSATIILLMLPIFPFALSLAEEWEERAVNFHLIRTGSNRYALTKITVASVTGFLVIFAGLLLFVLAKCLTLPLFIGSASNIYNMMGEQGKALTGIMLYIIHFGFSGSITASCAVLVSTFVTNRFVAAATPVVLHFTLLRFISTNLFPYEMLYLHPIFWIEGVYEFESPWVTLLVKAVTAVVLCAVMFAITRYKLRRKLAYA
jgi:hypothetical protein